MRKYDGASQDRIASPIEGLTQSRVSRVMRGHDRDGDDLLISLTRRDLLPNQFVSLRWDFPRA